MCVCFLVCLLLFFGVGILLVIGVFCLGVFVVILVCVLEGGGGSFLKDFSEANNKITTMR